MKEVAKDTLLVIVSHNLNEATSYADWIFSLNEGKLISNLSYDESYQEKDSLYLSNLDEMSNEEISSLNEKMENEGRRVIRSRKDLFRSTEEKKEPTGIPRKRSSYRFCSLTKTFFRILNRNWTRIVFIPLFLALICSMFSCIFSLASLGNVDYVSELVDRKQEDSFFVDYSCTKDDGSVFQGTILPICENYRKQIDSLSLKGAFAEIYKYPLYMITAILPKPQSKSPPVSPSTTLKKSIPNMVPDSFSVRKDSSKRFSPWINFTFSARRKSKERFGSISCIRHVD